MLTVSRARAFMCDLPAKTARLDAVQTFEMQETVFVELECADGGEPSLGYAYTIGTGGTAVLEMLNRYMLPKLIGADAALPEAIWKQMVAATRATLVGPITTLALAAIDTAVWDLRNRRYGLSLWQAAGGAQTSVPVYDTDGGWLQLSAEEAVVNAKAAVAAGMRGVKIKIGKPSALDDVARVSAVREAIGPGIALMVDANQSFTRDEAIRRAKLLEPFDLAWIEEPIAADDIEGHELLARAVSIPVAVGESLYSLGQFREYLSRRAATIVQVDVGRIGGITPWLKVAHLAEAFNVCVAPHFLMEIHVSLAAAVPNARWVEWIPQLDAVTTSRVNPVDGLVQPPTTPGLGIAWDHDALARLRSVSS